MSWDSRRARVLRALGLIALLAAFVTLVSMVLVQPVRFILSAIAGYAVGVGLAHIFRKPT